MIAHLDNGTALNLSPTAPTLGLRVVRWEFDFNDMCELMKNPKLLGILATRMPPASRKVEESVNAMSQRQWVGLSVEEKMLILLFDAEGRVLDYEDYANAIEAKLKEKNNG